MRTVTLQAVYEAIVRRHGLDPNSDAITYDTAAAIVEHINDRVGRAMRMWPFLELSHTEERAFRQVWNATKQFYRLNVATGKPDELFYIPNATYYRVKGNAVSDPPVGTLPTNTTYFEVMTPVDTYLEYDQPGKRSFDQVLGVYKTDPRLNGCNPCDLCLSYRPSEFGLDICCSAGPTVFVHYLITRPRFTMLQYAAGRTYAKGERRFYIDGNCYRALTTTSALPTDATAWALEPFPEVLAEYVKAGAYADSVKELPGGADQPKQVLAADAAAEADSAIHSEIDRLMSQGQRYYYTRPYYYQSGICVSQPWSGSVVSTLTDTDDSQAVYPSPVPGPQVTWRYEHDIVSLTGPGQPALNTIATKTILVGSLVEIVIDSGGTPERQTWKLVAGAAAVGDPGDVAPLDYNVTSNSKHWQKVG